VSRQIVRELWEDFERRVIDRVAPEAQRHEMRLAFYAGATGLQWVYFNLTQEGLTNEEIAVVLNDITEELEQFMGINEGMKNASKNWRHLVHQRRATDLYRAK
jgi:hypothetical protein